MKNPPFFLCLVIILFFIPILAGLAGSLFPAFGYFPILGGNEFSFSIWHRFWDYAGVESSIFLTFLVGMGGTLLSFLLTNLFCAAFYNKKFFYWIRHGLGPILSVPHVSLAIGMLLLLAPSGWVVRLISPWLSGWEQPLGIAIFPDQYGLGLMLALVVKEVPFLLLMTIGALNEIPTQRNILIAQSLGYGPISTWIKVILPQIYSRLRLPIFATIVFSVSVVDMALVLLPGSSPTLGMLILRWYSDADLSYQFMSAMGATLQIGLAIIAVLFWIGMEKISAIWFRYYIQSGRRYFGGPIVETFFVGIARLVASLMIMIGFFSLLLLMVWSFAGRWKFPDALPQKWSFRFWERHLSGVENALVNSLTIGVLASLIAIILVIGCLESEKNSKDQSSNYMLGLLYVPLLVPQVAFLFGVQLLSVWIHMDGYYLSVIWGHLLFVLPYVYLSLRGPYLSFDDRFCHAARLLGKDGVYIFFRIKIAMLLRSILVAFAVGFAVSIALYLPTLFLGAGRIETLTTEALALSSGGDRRVIGIYAFVQALLPFIIFAVATILPLWVYRNRLAMRGYR